MDQTEARGILTALRAEAEATNRRLGSLHKLIDGYLELFPELTTVVSAEVDTPGNDVRPKGQDAIRRVLMESQGKWYTVPLMLEELKQRDWLPDTDEPGNAVRASLSRVVNDPDFRKDRGQKTGAITYAYKPRSVTAPSEAVVGTDLGDTGDPMIDHPEPVESELTASGESPL